MSKTLTKPAIFGVPSLETARRIDDEDKVAAIHAAHYRLTARMRELARKFHPAFTTERSEKCAAATVKLKLGP